MVVVGTPVQSGDAGTIVCSDLSLVEPGAVSHEGCPLLTRQRVVLVDQGVKATVRWEMRDRGGQVVDLSSCLDCDTIIESSASISVSSTTGECGSIAVRISACDETGTIYEVAGAVDTPTLGLIRFQLPAAVYNTAGIWRVQIAILDGDGVPVFTNTGLISIERGLFGTVTQATGPLTINEIRFFLRDTVVENDLLMDVEFDDDEIIMAMVHPIQYWNESMPVLRRFMYTCATFPWRLHWLEGTVSRLFSIAGHHYLRNKLQASHGGVEVRDRDKNQEYMQLSQLYWTSFKEWVFHKKIELNASQCYGTLGSSYA